MFKKILSLFFCLALLVTSIPTSDAYNDSRTLLNSQTLTPEKTGYSPLDNEVERVLNYYISQGKKTPGDLVLACYKYLIDSVAYKGKDPLPKGYAVREIPPADDFDTSKLHGDVEASLALEPLFYREGVCNNYSAAFVCLLRRLGIPAMTVRGYYVEKGGQKDGHCWAVARLSGKYYVFDPEIDDWIQNLLKDKSYMKHYCVEQIGNPRYEIVSDSSGMVVPKEYQQVYLESLMGYNNTNGYDMENDGKYVPMRVNAPLLNGLVKGNPKPQKQTKSQNKKANQKTNKKVQKKSNKKVNKKTNKKVNKRTNKKVNKRNSKKIK